MPHTSHVSHCTISTSGVHSPARTVFPVPCSTTLPIIFQPHRNKRAPPSFLDASSPSGLPPLHSQCAFPASRIVRIRSHHVSLQCLHPPSSSSPGKSTILLEHSSPPALYSRLCRWMCWEGTRRSWQVSLWIHGHKPPVAVGAAGHHLCFPPPPTFLSSRWWFHPFYSHRSSHSSSPFLGQRWWPCFLFHQEDRRAQKSSWHSSTTQCPHRPAPGMPCSLPSLQATEQLNHLCST